MYDYDFSNYLNLENNVNEYYEKEASFFDGHHTGVNDFKSIILFKKKTKKTSLA